MTGEPTLAMTARERAAAIACIERSTQRRRDDALLPSYVERIPVVVLEYRHVTAIAEQALDRLDREIRTARPSAEGVRVGVHDDLIVVRRRGAFVSLATIEI